MNVIPSAFELILAIENRVLVNEIRFVGQLIAPSENKEN